MKTIVIASLTCLLGALLFSNGEEEEAAEKEAPMSRESLREKANPGPEHEKLAALAGGWTLSMQTRREPLAGTATMRMAVKGRFLVCEYTAGEGRLEESGIFTVGFDRRHGEWTLQAMDSSGTYAVFSRGKGEDGPNRVKLYGTDDDPHMKAMGFEKAFAHVLDFKDAGTFAIEVLLIDTRTEARREHKAMTYTFSRKAN